MALDRTLVRNVRAMDQYDLRRLMILARGLLMDADGVAEPTGIPVAGTTVTYRQEHVKCGKRGCTRCPHGPYWYGYWKQDGKSRSQYIGRRLAGQELEPVQPGRAPTTPDVPEP
ncbi:MAG: hypothetical protein ACI867_001018 [Glaciecola sp.]|jgi:hypothetical protein